MWIINISIRDQNLYSIIIGSWIFFALDMWESFLSDIFYNEFSMYVFLFELLFISRDCFFWLSSNLTCVKALHLLCGGLCLGVWQRRVSYYFMVCGSWLLFYWSNEALRMDDRFM